VAVVCLLHLHRWGVEDGVAIALSLLQRLGHAAVVTDRGERSYPLSASHGRAPSLMGLAADVSAAASTHVRPTLATVASAVQGVLAQRLPQLHRWACGALWGGGG
jgi:hypothetical protein